MAIEEFAPAKLNLALHVTGQRGDGLHLLDSLVCFADVGDRLTVTPADADVLNITGPFARGLPTGPDNLIWKAASLLPERPPLRVELHKALPPASGIGGGTADAAAMIRAIRGLTGAGLPGTAALMAVGADLPVCLAGTACMMRGAGENLAPVPTIPPLHAILVNPGRPVPTGAVFSGLREINNPPMTAPSASGNVDDWLDWLQSQRNDLADAAVRAEPAVAEVLDALRGLDTARVVRMSGSGGTCLAIFGDPDQAGAACREVSDMHPDWWVVQTRLNVS